MKIFKCIETEKKNVFVFSSRQIERVTLKIIEIRAAEIPRRRNVRVNRTPNIPGSCPVGVPLDFLQFTRNAPCLNHGRRLARTYNIGIREYPV